MSDIIDIQIEYIDSVTNISIEEIIAPIDHIVLEQVIPDIKNIDIYTDVPSVYSVNMLTGNVILTYYETLGTVSPSFGVYSYSINHNLNFSLPIVAIYNTSNQQVYGDVDIINNNEVEINSLIDLNGYKVVVQR